ncbi:MAG: hypothetical protein HWE18_05275 [Gammaproteobacteria bacterium]|nr:hypothetical protein [Gammaproteobacteria bacterium]
MLNWPQLSILIITLLTSIYSFADLDSDGDGFSDAKEISLGLNPYKNEFNEVPLSIIDILPTGGKLSFKSPDGRHIYFNGAAEMYDINQDSGLLENSRPTGAKAKSKFSVISPDGKHVYTTDSFNENYLNKYLRNIDTGELTLLTTFRNVGDINMLNIGPKGYIWFTTYSFGTTSLTKAILSDDGEITLEAMGSFPNAITHISFDIDDKYYLPQGNNVDWNTNAILYMNGNNIESKISSSQYIFRLVENFSLQKERFYVIAGPTASSFYLSLLNNNVVEFNSTTQPKTYVGKQSVINLLSDNSSRLIYALTINSVKAYRMFDPESGVISDAPKFFGEISLLDSRGGMGFTKHQDKLYVFSADKIYIINAGQAGIHPPICN